MAERCPIDQTKLTMFNTYELQDGNICYDCADKIGLIKHDSHQLSLLAKAAKSVITVADAQGLINAGQTVDYEKLETKYKASLKTNSVDNKAFGNEGGSPDQSSTTENKAHDITSSTPTKKNSKVPSDPKVWKGDGVSGFMYGAVFGLISGAINMMFLNIWHLGLIVWIATWLIMGMSPHFKDKRSGAEIKQDLKEAQDNLRSDSSHANPNTQGNTIIINNSITSTGQRNHSHGGLKCPKCGSSNVILVSNTANIKKEKKSVSLNLNPLHPLTPFNVKTKKIKKHSKLKSTTAVLTAGMSAPLTGGTRSNKSREYHCQNCGKVFYKK